MGIFDLKAEYNRNRIIKEQDTLENELSALRSRLAECERVAEKFANCLTLNKEIQETLNKSDDNCLWLYFGEDDESALAAYEAYKSSHEVKK